MTQNLKVNRRDGSSNRNNNAIVYEYHSPTFLCNDSPFPSLWFEFIICSNLICVYFTKNSSTLFATHCSCISSTSLRFSIWFTPLSLSRMYSRPMPPWWCIFQEERSSLVAPRILTMQASHWLQVLTSSLSPSGIGWACLGYFLQVRNYETGN